MSGKNISKVSFKVVQILIIGPLDSNELKEVLEKCFLRAPSYDALLYKDPCKCPIILVKAVA